MLRGVGDMGWVMGRQLPRWRPAMSMEWTNLEEVPAATAPAAVNIPSAPQPVSTKTVNPLTVWAEDATVTNGTFEPVDNSERLIFPWARDSHAFDPRVDPDNLFDDDDPREARRRTFYGGRGLATREENAARS
uniref:Uncharacterized protein n=2 Tax=Hemiselmis andersenii TaxID=464988 RepID=A0A7S1H3J9_HEMAN|mmetsp:Transcript_32907/g.80244  ORF Transcript_32907/g.80244 Transcript_32907/m.80244 type:complete len:133 (+) Transcript_32907:2-400(+)